MDLASLGKEPINEAQPTGSDVRYDPEFEQLQAEIDKMSNPAASGGTDWKRVSELASGILANKSKDLLVASYLAVAQVRVAQMEGFAIGLRIYRDLVEHFWDGLFPAKKRMRGRIAAIEWWLEKIETAVEGVKLEPLPAERIEGFREDIRKIDTVLRENVGEPPLLRPVERIVENIPIMAEQKKEPAPEPTSQDQGPPAEAAQKRASEVKRETAPTGATVPARLTEIDSAASAEKVLDEALSRILRVSSYLQKENLADAVAYRWIRIATWTGVRDVPPATDGRTIILPPDPMALSVLHELRANGNWQGLVELAEEKTTEYVFWLDLHRFVAEGLSNLGTAYQDAQDVVCEEATLFVRRLPGVENLLFADGTPFADGDTVQWLKGMAASGAGGGKDKVSLADGGDGDQMTEAVEKAQELLKKKKLGEAVSILELGLRRSFSRKGQMLWRLALAQLLLSAKKPQLALPHLEAVLQDVDTYRLEEWDPDLAFNSLKTIWFGLDGYGDEATREQAPGVLKRLARLSPTEAIRLEKR